ncbi:hypothetical protein FDP41_003656 [Naegleria fowleri]|uniref:Flavin-containing monooxygenase 1 n=1 Tax=Naegleria fowleri TaxID=5763 RepID=A0A6A5BGK8_NAEFO|nr:uncharacterized protein FDP41_003656 [Naegleria fowleri]KAF0977003.1 hypothetical protein FDP41_003656 [Naegleria fowleri]CAG4713793.1 unnamed protein product [Naegleria fowleri]
MAQSSDQGSNSFITKRVCIVGCGSSGLSAIKALLESNFTLFPDSVPSYPLFQNSKDHRTMDCTFPKRNSSNSKEKPSILFEPVCYEATNDIGGLWRFSENESEFSSVYKSTVINTSKEMMSFSDFPIPDEFPPFLPHYKIIEYFKMYANHFSLWKYIQFETRVVSITKKGEKYLVKTVKQANSSNDTDTTRLVEMEEEFDFIMACTGHHSKPQMAHFEGLKEHFKGHVMHSHAYKDPFKEEFLNKNALVIGIGNSGGDIATELAKNVAKSVTLSTRSGTWIIPRESLFGSPLDHVPRYLWLLPTVALQFVMENTMKLFYGNIEGVDKNLQPRHHLLSSHPTINSELVGKIRTGVINVQRNISKFLNDGHSVEFEDGTVVHNIDTVIMCTGYKIEFPYLNEISEDLSLCHRDDNQVHIYKYMFHPSHPSIAFIGLVQPLGAIMPIAELQSRIAAQAFRGDCHLPSETEMKADIEMKKKEMQKRYLNSKRHTIQVDYTLYMDELAEMIQVKPYYLHYLFTNPRLGVKLLNSPAFPVTYRIEDDSPFVNATQRQKEREQAISTLQKVSYDLFSENYQSNPNDRKKSIQERESFLIVVWLQAVFLLFVYVIYLLRRRWKY